MVHCSIIDTVTIPKLLAWPQPTFMGRLVVDALGCSRKLMVYSSYLPATPPLNTGSSFPADFAKPVPLAVVSLGRR
jgi:hypothetical protein